MYFYGHCGLAPKKCLLEFLSENSGGRESAASQRTEHTGSPLMLRGKSSCDVPASVIGRLKVTGPERAVKPRADLQFLVGEWPSQHSHAAIDRL